MILNTNSFLTTLLCYLHPLIVTFHYHDDQHVAVHIDVDNALGLVCIVLAPLVALLIIST